MPTNPRLFWIKHSNRNFNSPDTRGKNQFNSSFPASLVAYLYSKSLDCIYIKADNNNEIIHSTLSANSLFWISPLDDHTFYSFESIYSPYQTFYIWNTPRIDLVIQDTRTWTCLKWLEIKLTALPDNSTCELEENLYSCELVIRPDTISYLACSIAKNFSWRINELKRLLWDLSWVSWEDERDVISKYPTFLDIIEKIIKHEYLNQEPLVLQPIRKTDGKKPTLATNCLDVFVRSNLALIHLFSDFSVRNITKIGRTERTLIWLIRMLQDFSLNEQIDASTIIDQLSYNTKNDKAFSVNWRVTHKFLNCDELIHPRILKSEIKNIILWWWQNLLSPERRFDAIIFNTPDLFN